MTVWWILDIVLLVVVVPVVIYLLAGVLSEARGIVAYVFADIGGSWKTAGVGGQKFAGAALHDEPSAVSWLSMMRSKNRPTCPDHAAGRVSQDQPLDLSPIFNPMN